MLTEMTLLEAAVLRTVDEKNGSVQFAELATDIDLKYGWNGKTRATVDRLAAIGYLKVLYGLPKEYLLSGAGKQALDSFLKQAKLFA